MQWRDVAFEQQGAVARHQLRANGLTQREVRGLAGRRELVPMAPGVYLPGGVPASFAQRAWGAVLWTGGVLSHRSAAQLWRLPVASSASLHVTVPIPLSRRRPPTITVHRVPLDAGEITRIDGLPVTRRARTIVDLLRTERYLAARDLFDRSVQTGWVGLDDVVRAYRDEPGRTGNAQLRKLVGAAEPGAHAESERVLHRLLRSAGLPGWVAQHRIALGARVAFVDVAFPEQRLVIEIDGRRYHDERSDAFEDDRARQNELIAAGWRVLRFTWRALTRYPDRVLASILGLLTVE
jgi:very-short-patch-repair endonuclease